MAKRYYLLIDKVIHNEGSFYVLRALDIFTKKIMTVKGHMYTADIGLIYVFDLERAGRDSSFADRYQGSLSQEFRIVNYSTILKEHLEANPQLEPFFFHSFLPEYDLNYVSDVIYDFYGIKTPEILLNNCEMLRDIPNINAQILEHYIIQIKRYYVRPTILSFLYNQGVNYQRSYWIYDFFGDRTYYEITQDPYILTKLGGIPINKVDNLDLTNDFNPNDDRRLGAAIVHFSEKMSNDKGHMYVTHGSLYSFLLEGKIRGFTNLTQARVFNLLEDLHKSKIVYSDKPSKIYSSYFSYVIEKEVADIIKQKVSSSSPLINFNKSKSINNFTSTHGFSPSPEQSDVLDKLNSTDILVITGQAGSGKTTLVNLIISALEQSDIEYALLSTTGRASKVLAKATKREAKTIHAYLGYNGKGFVKNKMNLIDADVVIVDEASMCDSYLAHALLTSMSYGTKVIFVGDVNQLPPVGPGGVLENLCKIEEIPKISLKTVFRQEEGSEILKQALKVLNKKAYDSGSKSSEYKLLITEDVDFVRSSALRVMRKARSLGKSSVIIAPTKKGAFGVIEINKFLQEELNPNFTEDGKGLWFKGNNYHFFEKDKVMIIKNDWDRNVCNGDVGTITKITKDKVFVTINNQEISYSILAASQTLELAYCTTVHKSQGCEYDYVVCILQKSHSRMLTVNLIYTAFTRAKEKLIVFSDNYARTYRAINSTSNDFKNSWIKFIFDKNSFIN